MKSNIFFLLSLLLFGQTIAQPNHTYQRVYLSGIDAANTVDWEFKVSDGERAGEWATIAVPSNWELQGFGNYNYGHDHKNPDRVLGKESGEYRHTFEVPKTYRRNTIMLVFDGVMTDTEVRVNGKSAGLPHQGGFYRFKYDISRLLKYGESNVLEVKVNKHSSNESVNRAERQADFWIFGGIFRPVYLEVLPSLHFERIAVDPKADGAFEAEITLNKLEKNLRVEIEIFDTEGKVSMGKISDNLSGRVNRIQGRFEGIEAWHPENPVLYLARCRLMRNSEVLYSKEERIGFRTVDLRPNDGFYINGIRTIFKGVNRHSFHPQTGRALSEANHFEDIRLMKEMNMNAVRSSHYPPDERFLELCDSLGLFVLNEVTGWHDSYDRVVGPKLIKATVLAHANHPSVVIWDHGNEGGWDFESEKGFHENDIQKRPVIYPWLQRNRVDTYHYPKFQMGINRLSSGADPFMPTEFLHGLYDGGHGAGLEDFWNDYMSNPLSAGGFLWVFADEAVVRTDKGNILDPDGNHAPDGILGPYKEKEGSFYSIKNIWSPVQVKPVTVNKFFDGRLFLENRYLITNLNACTFSWELIGLDAFKGQRLIAEGSVDAPDIPPGETRGLQLPLPKELASADLLVFKAEDKFGKEIQTWAWPVKMPDEFASKALEKIKTSTEKKLSAKAEGNMLKAVAGNLEISFCLEKGTILEINKGGQQVSFKGGPVPVGVNYKIEKVQWKNEGDSSLVLETSYSGYPRYTRWTLNRSGLLHLEAAELQARLSEVDYVGITFDYPEDKVKGVKWIGKGPYRVWKNRMKGPVFGLWEKDYNNTITGHSFESLVYPEFKGYHANMYAMELMTEEGGFRIYTETPNLFMRLFTPEDSPHATPGVKVPFPDGDISFLLAIPAIGTKFYNASDLGPQSQKNHTAFRPGGDSGYPISLWFDFR
ncbi:MAG: beta-galactosidase [Cyclobacteriaceae bacterium]|nr:beta-galactosidase [Cyclobacteriaceae bacterium]